MHEQRERLHVTLASIGDAVLATDSQGRVTFLNPVAAALTGWPEAEALGKDLTEVLRIINEYTRQVVENPITKVIREGTVVGLANHTLLIARDGMEHPIDDSGAPMRDSVSSAGRRHTCMRTPLDTSRSTMRRLASFATAPWQSGQRKQ